MYPSSLIVSPPDAEGLFAVRFVYTLADGSIYQGAAEYLTLPVLTCLLADLPSSAGALEPETLEPETLEPETLVPETLKRGIDQDALDALKALGFPARDAKLALASTADTPFTEDRIKAALAYLRPQVS